MGDVREALLSRDAHVVVTGASGWLGQAALEMLEAVYGPHLQSRVTAFCNTAKSITLRSGTVLAARRFADLAHIELPQSIILHCAFLTREHAQLQPLEIYAAANRGIRETMLRAIARNGALGVFVPSSGAVYRADRSLETDQAVNPYGVLKREDEKAFTEIAQRLGFQCTVLRVFNLSGPFINKISSYALASIIHDVHSGGPIRLRADVPIWRSYAAVDDVMNVAVAALLRGEHQAPFDTAGDETIEISDLARRVAMLMGRPDVPIIRPELTAEGKSFYVGAGDVFFAKAQAAGLALMRLDAQITSTAAYLTTTRVE
ncbi:MAG: NAD(P)-dependent oxidoreductase [Acidocella sp.]|nr:NAD(P)-dependent oxidoreductase [Acidocella sp.]